MKKIIRNIIKEEFDWAINDVSPFLEIGEPVTKSNPKNIYRLYLDSESGGDYSFILNDWVHFADNSNDMDTLIKCIKLCDYFSHGNEIDELVREYTKKGETWMFNKEELIELEEEISEVEGLYEEDKEEIVRDYLQQFLENYSLSFHTSDYHINYVSDYKVTYFDEFGVEHKVKVNNRK